MDLHLKDKVVLVTGGTGGIGTAIVKGFLKEGAKVAFSSTRQTKIDALLPTLEAAEGQVAGFVADMTKEESGKLVMIAAAALEEKKAENIEVIEIDEISPLADYFLIASGTNRNQVHAIADFVEEKLGRAGYEVQHTEGYESANWILLDYGDIIVHIFDRKNRLYYDLDRIWRDGMAISEDELGKEED